MASAVGAKTARACDICVRKRARFYCGPDDAFLCQGCDESVHSANPLARRHERVRLKSASSSSIKNASFLPTWHRGPTRKPRTPRDRKKSPNSNNVHHLLVPELDTSTSVEDEQEEEERLPCRVPVFEYDRYNSGFLPPSDFDMAEFAADVEALLGKGLDGEHACGIEELGLLVNSPHERDDSSAIKAEKEEEEEEEMEALIERRFDYDSPVDVKVGADPEIYEEEEKKKKDWRRKMLLRLDYDAISNSWGNQGSPWMNGKRPDLNPDDDFLRHSTTGDCGAEVQGNGEAGLMKGGGDGGREARVSRYREKRRTRLFSKKIRYQVRKLNAEKRPRMKGRFVKRSSFPLLAESH